MRGCFLGGATVGGACRGWRLDSPLWDFVLALGDFVGVGVLDDPNEQAPTVGRSGTPAPTREFRRASWPPCVKGAVAEWRLGDCFGNPANNPSVTASPCHLPLHKGGKTPPQMCANPVKGRRGRRPLRRPRPSFRARVPLSAPASLFPRPSRPLFSPPASPFLPELRRKTRRIV